MTAPCPHPGTRPGPHLGTLMAERRRLLNIGYRMLGSLQDAEDVVQETYARWYGLSEEEQRAIGAPLAWLTRVASRICLDHLTSARVRREHYTGEWLPEPVRHSATWTSAGDEGGADPADRITLDESVSMGMLVVLDSFTPAERVAFVLHDIFGMPFTEIADTVGRTPPPAASSPPPPVGASPTGVPAAAPHRSTSRSSPRSATPARPAISTRWSRSSTPPSSREATEAAGSVPPCARSSAGTRSPASSSASCATNPESNSWRRTSTAPRRQRPHRRYHDRRRRPGHPRRSGHRRVDGRQPRQAPCLDRPRNP